MNQSTNKVVMIRPVKFNYNASTAVDNVYQKRSQLQSKLIQEKALAEFEGLRKCLEEEGIKVKVFDDTLEPATPDSIFPNNWFSTHEGIVCLYPMYVQNRRLEVAKFSQLLKDYYQADNILDFTGESEVVEGTGAIIFDRVNKRAFTSLSKRSNKGLFEKISNSLGYKPYSFKSSQFGKEIYHTNVMMSITSDFIFVASQLIDEEYRQGILDELARYHRIIELSSEQIVNFAGNLLELEGRNGKFLIMSDRAYNSLSQVQKETIEAKLRIRHVPVNTIEDLGGGSVRCMLAEIF